MSTVLILGASSYIGAALLKELSSTFNVYGTYHTKQLEFTSKNLFQLDISNINNLKNLLLGIKPEIIISSIRGDYNYQLLAHTEIANFLKFSGGKLYFCSSCKVFDNDKSKPHYEADQPNAKSDYGIYKANCERAITEILGENAIILRIPMIWGKNSPRLNSLISKLNNSEEIELPTNLYMNYNTDVFLAKQIHYIMTNNLKGTFHLGTTEAMNYNNFVTKIISNLGYDKPRIKSTTLPSNYNYLAILSNRNDIPANLQISNKHMLDSLTYH